MAVKNQKLIVVLGMHRSGASTIMRGLQVMGKSLGDSVMPVISFLRRVFAAVTFKEKKS